MFEFKQFKVDDGQCAMKIGTDAVLLGAWTDTVCPNGSMPSDVLDLGCGSGVLALMMAQRCPDAHIFAIEIDTEAAAAATGNFAASPWADRLTAITGNALDLDLLCSYDLIVCNPPFFKSGLLSPNKRRAMARSYHDGLSPESAIRLASKLLRPGGSLAMITPADLEHEYIYLAEINRMKVYRLCRVSTVPAKLPTRLLMQLSNVERPLEISNLSLRNPDNTMSDQYRTLTADFYLDRAK